MTKKRLPKRIQAQGTLEEYYQKLNELGYKHLSSGAYAKVFAKGKDVIKVAINSPRYEKFLQYVLANQHNPHFPKIYSVQRFNLNKEGGPYQKTAVVVQMERLAHDWGRSWEDTALFEGYTKDGVTPAINETKTILKRLWKETKACSDLGGDNILYRDETPVITDPVYG